MPRKKKSQRSQKTSASSGQLSLFDLIETDALTQERRATLQVLMALQPSGQHWRGRDILPPGSFIDHVVHAFETHTDIPLEIPAFMALHGMAAWLLDKGCTVEIQGASQWPDLWTTVLASSGSSKTYTSRILQKIMPLRLFPEVTSAAQFVADLRDHNRAAWFQDEWAQVIRRMNSQTFAEELKDYLLRVYDNATLSRRTRNETITVEDPALVILGTTVHETFLQNVSLESMLDGFMQRFQFVIADQRRGRPVPLYPLEKPQYLDPMREAWDRIQRTNLQQTYITTPEAEQAYCRQFGTLFDCFQSVPLSFFRRILWRSIKYALVYHVLLGKVSAEIDAEDIGWAIRVSELHLHDARRLLDGYEMSELEKVIRKAEALRDRLGRPLTPRDLISGVRDIRNAPMARFVLEMITPPPAPEQDNVPQKTGQAA